MAGGRCARTGRSTDESGGTYAFNRYPVPDFSLMRVMMTVIIHGAIRPIARPRRVLPDIGGLGRWDARAAYIQPASLPITDFGPAPPSHRRVTRRRGRRKTTRARRVRS